MVSLFAFPNSSILTAWPHIAAHFKSRPPEKNSGDSSKLRVLHARVGGSGQPYFGFYKPSIAPGIGALSTHPLVGTAFVHANHTGPQIVFIVRTSARQERVGPGILKSRSSRPFSSCSSRYFRSVSYNSDKLRLSPMMNSRDVASSSGSKPDCLASSRRCSRSSRSPNKRREVNGIVIYNLAALWARSRAATSGSLGCPCPAVGQARLAASSSGLASDSAIAPCPHHLAADSPKSPNGILQSGLCCVSFRLGCRLQHRVVARRTPWPR